MLRPAGDAGLDLGRAQIALHLLDHLGQELVPAGRGLGDHPDDLVVDLGMQRAEGEVLQLPLDRVHAQPVGQRGEDLQGLRGDPGLLVGAQVVQRPHVVQPVRELDHQDPDVLAHRDDHLADGLGLGRVAVGDLVQLGAAVDQPRDLAAELLRHLPQRVVGVLDGVVQQRGAQRRLGHAQLGQDRGDRQRVGDVGVPALPGLALVLAVGDPVGPLDQMQVRLRVVGPDDPEQRVQGRCLRPAGAQPGDPLPHPDPRNLGGGGVRRFGWAASSASGGRISARRGDGTDWRSGRPEPDSSAFAPTAAPWSVTATPDCSSTSAERPF